MAVHFFAISDVLMIHFKNLGVLMSLPVLAPPEEYNSSIQEKLPLIIGSASGPHLGARVVLGRDLEGASYNRVDLAVSMAVMVRKSGV